MLVRLDDAEFEVTSTNQEFWRRVSLRDWEPDSFDVVRKFLAWSVGPFIDVGAWIGPLTLYAAALGSTVVAYEPDPVARTELLANVALNPSLAERITVRPQAVGTGRSGRRLGNITSPLGGDSMSSLLFADANVGWLVNEIPLTDVLAGAPHPALIKIDIEGAEVEVLSAASEALEALPTLLLSVHPRFWKPDPDPRLRRLVQLLARYPSVTTPDGQPFVLTDLFDEPWRSGLLELVVASGTPWTASSTRSDPPQGAGGDQPRLGGRADR